MKMEDTMKRFGTLLLASTLFAGAGAWSALALDKVSGTIKSIDPENRELTLDDGKTYNVASNVTLEGLRAGDKVTVKAETKNGQNIAAGIEQTGMAQTLPAETTLGKER